MKFTQISQTKPPNLSVRREDVPEFITWTGADTVLGEELLAKQGNTIELKVIDIVLP